MTDSPFAGYLAEVRACTRCAAELPLPPRPLLQASASATILIASQAPGRRAHASGIPFSDASGERLRDWLGLPPALFYDASRVAILPMGFCYPGTGRHGDLPPRPECAASWREGLLQRLPELQLTLVIGRYAMDWHMPENKGTLTECVRQWRKYWPTQVALPHPSPRNNIWLRRNPWFEEELLPVLRQRVAEVLNDGHEKGVSATGD